MDSQLRPDYSDREVPRHVYDDASGTHWTVREMDASAVPGARAPRCLIFDSGTVARRIWRYPRDWGVLPPSTLLGLMQRP